MKRFLFHLWSNAVPSFDEVPGLFIKRAKTRESALKALTKLLQSERYNWDKGHEFHPLWDSGDEAAYIYGEESQEVLDALSTHDPEVIKKVLPNGSLIVFQKELIEGDIISLSLAGYA